MIFFSLSLPMLTRGQMLQSEGQVLVRGTIFDEFSGKPISIDIEFRDPTGKKIKCRSEANGSYQQVLQSGAKYSLIFSNFDIARKLDTIYIEKT